MTDSEIVAGAVARPPAARGAFLDGACGGDPDRRRRIEQALADHPEVAATRTFAHDGSAAPGESPIPLQPSERPGALGRLGHYDILAVLGRGGFGIVYRALDDVLQRVVAVKVLAPEMAATSPARKRFLREARASAAVRHENVVQVYAVEEQPLPYLVMEFIPGESLQQRLDRTGPLAPAEVVRIGRQIAEGLAAAHEQGLIHRDVKPGNVLIETGPNERAKLTGFGLARAADDASLSQSGAIVGTPLYMSPEQAHGARLDHRSDLFSLGSVLYALCAGRPPFRAESTLAVMKRVCEDTPRPVREVIPEVPEWLGRVIEKLHAKSPDDRFQTAREVADALAAGESGSVGARPVVADPRPEPARRYALAAGALLLVAALGTAAVLGLALTRRAAVLVVEAGDADMTVTLIDEQTGVTRTLAPGSSEVPPGFYRAEVRPAPGQQVERATVTEGNHTRQVTPGSFPLKLDRRARVTMSARTGPAPAPVNPPPVPAPVPAPVRERPEFAVAPFNEARAKAHQEAWAKYLGAPVEFPNSLGMKFRLIPPGEFPMGSATDDPKGRPDERPQHTVRLTRAFHLGTTEVTVAQFRAFVSATGYQTVAEVRNGAVGLGSDGNKGEMKEGVNWQERVTNWTGKGKPENTPLLATAWADAQAFCEWLSTKEGRKYRLPTEAEWEFACRAGTVGPYWFGSEMDERCAHFGPKRRYVAEAGHYPANPFGLFDTHGNAGEWCADAPRAYTAAAATDPVGTGLRRVHRGGHLFSKADGGGARSADRAIEVQDRPIAFVGFRVACEVEARAKP